MGHLTQRIPQFRGINRSLQQNALDISYAHNAENIDIVGGKLTNKVGSERLVMSTNVPAANPIIHFSEDGDYMILRDHYIYLGTANGTVPHGRQYNTRTFGPYDVWPASYVAEPEAHVLKDVNNLSGLSIRGVGRSYVSTFFDFFEDEGITPVSKETVIASGMLDDSGSSAYYRYRGFLVDGARANTAFYYLGEWEETENNETVTKRGMVCRKFGTGQSMAQNLEITQILYDDEDRIYRLIASGTITERAKKRAEVDGIYIFDKLLGSTVTDEDINDAYFWLKVENAVPYPDNRVEFIVKPTLYTETQRYEGIVTPPPYTYGSHHLRTPSYVFIRGECSDMPVTCMKMFYGRLFAAGHRSNHDAPRRLYWSCLPGDGRTIEDWTQTEASVDTSGGHVDIGDPSDGYIVALSVCGSQLLIFTQTRLWRLYGTSPSNYRLELVGNLEGAMLSNPVEIGGAVYWLSLAGISYYNGSYIVSSDDDYNTRHILEDMPSSVIDAMSFATVHAELFDNSIMFAFDQVYQDNVGYALIIRYELETANVMFYKVPCANFLQQFTWAHTMNYGPVNGSVVNNETRYFQAIVKKDDTMVLTQWHDWGRQNFGWYDGQAVESVWETDWDDFRTPETALKAQTVLMRGSGAFDLCIESEVNKDVINVLMPDNPGRVMDVTPRYAEGRSMKLSIKSDKEFEIYPYMTILYETGSVR